jgi:hypothetical protein
MEFGRLERTECLQYVCPFCPICNGPQSYQTSQSFIVMASSNEFSRKILNSPTYAEPCLVHSAKQILRADNWYVYCPA